MKDHEYYLELISRFVDKDLLADEEAELKTHLSECGECRDFLDFCLGINADTLLTDAPPELVANVMSHVRGNKTHDRKKRGLRFWLPRGFAAAAACIAVVMTLRFSGTLINSPSVNGAKSMAAGAPQPELYSVSADSADEADAGDYSAADKYDAADYPENSIESNVTDMLLIYGTLTVADDGEMDFKTSDEDVIAFISGGLAGKDTRFVVQLDDPLLTGSYEREFEVCAFEYDSDVDVLTLTLK